MQVDLTAQVRLNTQEYSVFIGVIPYTGGREVLICLPCGQVFQLAEMLNKEKEMFSETQKLSNLENFTKLLLTGCMYKVLAEV